ncbi:hypothetical protein F2Q70_00005498 [Brassica cretica]|uniref:Bacterial surface antigen (D15) domain-containing protein n=1 Tax=Brassica cretica TaxID=69181 RepID=A0A8S9J660_BRACR|nr:hypothetical protein F2Q70_00005498 [Brassica cretica]
MATFATNGQLTTLPAVSTTGCHLSTSRKYSAPSSSYELRYNAPSPRFPSLTCCCSSPNRSTEPSSRGHLLQSLGKSLFFGSISSLFSTNFSGGGGGGGDGNLGGSGGGRGGGDGGLWRDLFSLATPVAVAAEEHSPEWDSHGLPANIVVQLNKLSGLKKYKISDVLFFDRQSKTTASAEDSFSEMVPIHPGKVYTKDQLQNELETLTTSGMFEKVDLLGNTKPDGALGLTFSFIESTWKNAERFRCINVGLMTQPNPIAPDSDMTDREMIEYMRNQDKEYKRRIEKARPCLLPGPVQREMMLMLRDQRNVSSRLLRRIGDKVLKWYQDNGYAYANVTNFGSLNSKELVCEVSEGDITRLVIQFQDKLGYVVEGNTQISIIHREIPKQVLYLYSILQCNVLNMEAANQAVKNIFSLNLFSNVEINPRPDEKNEGGVVVEIKLREADRKSAEVSTEWSIVPGPGGAPSLRSSQVDQGLGIGNKFPFFNRHQLSLTKFIQLKRVEQGSGKPQPPVLVLHGHYGGCVGDLPSYEAFGIGGPYSVRGYTMGELGASRNILELSAEIRVPVKNTHVYAFAEHGNDLGSSKDVKGNPTEAYRRMGHGSSYGFGVKLGQVRAEYAVDHNRGTGAFFLRFGERY